MLFMPILRKFNRRTLILGSAGAVGLAVAPFAWNRIRGLLFPPPLNWSPGNLLREFDYGVVKQENGQRIREFRLVSQPVDIPVEGKVFTTWTYNGRIPGPTLRATEGDRIRVIYTNQDFWEPHSIHFHGLHSAAADGLDPVSYGKTVVYEFEAKPFGVHLYHCHVGDIAYHLGKGMYGMMVVDPKQARSPADEMVLIMAGLDINGDERNEFLTFNGIPHYYMHHPIAIQRSQLVRLYLLNMTEYEAPLSFHLHANFFQIYPTGRTLEPVENSDVVTLGISERAVVEFSYSQPGKYMFHPHQDWLAQKGCEGFFEVQPT